MLLRMLEIKNGVDHVLYHLGTGNGALLRDVGNEKDRCIVGANPVENFVGRVLDLVHGARVGAGLRRVK